ncbi:fumarylacetoacetate hydrolase family protein [Aminobacter sp. AP02]|uniref:fumarylacetoacetate hydrolase family protein n=1 Tax=Aminobacter sp. AP02 TaxID=2135737 RepID=UPI000D6AFA70|nr:fumarylacetoacetate hydrolase family protein [Aminobacter sp. AP02]PWK75475.1 fumarylacetoacetate (FAA) hydrolase [Aminobacter sp. AP02]
MKLATLKNGSRDGKLVIVSRDLTRYTDASFLAPSLQAALDDWRRISPHLAALAESLEVGSVPSSRFHEHDAHSPLPRAYQRLGNGDAFVGPRDPIELAGKARDARVEAAVSVIVSDVAMGVTEEKAKDAVALIVLSADTILDGGQAGTSALSPVAVTPDELGDGWDGAVHLPLLAGARNVASAWTSFPKLIAGAAATRPIGTGAIVRGAAETLSVSLGDTLRVEMKDKAGHSIFGAIERQVGRFEPA